MIGYSTGFIAKIGFPSSKGSTEVCYPLASKILPFDHVTKVDFRRTAPGYKECCAAFAAAAGVMGVIEGRDFVEEYVAVKIWPLTVRCLPGSFAKVKVEGLEDSLPYPSFGLGKPEGGF